MRWDELIFHRMLTELCLVGILKTVYGKRTATKKELLEDLRIFIAAEREAIREHGRKEAIRVYRYVYQCRAVAEIIDHVLTYDFIDHYQRVIDGRPSAYIEAALAARKTTSPPAAREAKG